MTTPDAKCLNLRLSELACLQIPCDAVEAVPSWVRGPEDVAELALWGLCNNACEQPVDAVVLAAWFRDREDVRDALAGWLWDPDDVLATAAAISLYGVDPAAHTHLVSKVRLDLSGDRELAADLLGHIRGRGDPGARALTVLIADLDPEEAALGAARILAHTAPLAELAAASHDVLAIAEAITPLLALREEPQAAALTVAAIDDSVGWVAEKALYGLNDRGDPTCIEPLLRTWESYACISDRHTEMYRGEQDYRNLGFADIVDALAADPAGHVELERLAADEDPAVAVLARSFLVRAAPSPEGLDMLRDMLASTNDPDDREPMESPQTERFVPARLLLAEQDPLSRGVVSLDPAPRISWWRPPWQHLAPRAPSLEPVVPVSPSCHRGWRWLPTPEVRPGTLYEPWSELPVVAEVSGYAVRWSGPLVDMGFAELFDGMTEGLGVGYGDICGLLEWYDFPDEPFETAGDVSRAWGRVVLGAAKDLATRGGESDVEIWLAWLGFQLGALHDALKARAS